MVITASVIIAAILAATGGISITSLARQPEINRLRAQVKKLQAEINNMHEAINKLISDIESIRLMYQYKNNSDIFAQKGELETNKAKLIYAFSFKEYLELKVGVLIDQKDLSQQEYEFVDAFALVLENKIPNDNNGEIIKQFLKSYILQKYSSEINQFITPDLNDIVNNIKKRISEFEEKNKSDDVNRDNLEVVPELEIMALNDEQTRYLYSLQLLLIENDIKLTKKDADKTTKILWKNQWEKAILKALGKEKSLGYFIRNEDFLYSQMELAYNYSSSKIWYYLIAFETTIFNPYFALDNNKESKKLWKKIKLESKYMQDVYTIKQHIVDIDTLNSMIKCYNKNIKHLTGKTEKAVWGLIITTVITVATGGIAGIFAPSIAVMLAGGGMAGLYGQALVNASLAFIGGGALAAGGLGMAGGTAVIVGGGALFGMAAGSSTTASISAMMLISSDGYAILECAKLLSFAEIVLLNSFKLKKEISKISQTIEEQVENFSKKAENLDAKDKSDKKTIKVIKQNIKYLHLCNKTMKKLIK